jgi:hypothetical protein
LALDENGGHLHILVSLPATQSECGVKEGNSFPVRIKTIIQPILSQFI